MKSLPKTVTRQRFAPMGRGRLTLPRCRRPGPSVVYRAGVDKAFEQQQQRRRLSLGAERTTVKITAQAAVRYCRRWDTGWTALALYKHDWKFSVPLKHFLCMSTLSTVPRASGSHWQDLVHTPSATTTTTTTTTAAVVVLVVVVVVVVVVMTTWFARHQQQQQQQQQQQRRRRRRPTERSASCSQHA